MRRPSGLAFSLLLGGVTLATTPALGSPPTFEQYAVAAATPVRPAKVRLESHPKARMYRTRLRDGAKDGPNFAGHYTIVTYGCGTACQELAIVDAKTGRVFFPEQMQPAEYVVHPAETDFFQYRRDSRLLVVAGQLNGGDGAGLHYLAWDGSALKAVFFVPHEKAR